jgi:hypothetical protein
MAREQKEEKARKDKLGEAHKWIRWRWMAWRMKNMICLSLIKVTPSKVLIRRCGMMWMKAWGHLERH